MAMTLKIDGVAIRHPADMGFESYNLTKSGRVASGKMIIDLIAKKRKFTFAYSVVSGKDLKKIRDLIDGTKMFFPLVYTDDADGCEKTAIVYSGAIKAKRWRTDGNMWYWKDLQFDLIEQ